MGNEDEEEVRACRPMPRLLPGVRPSPSVAAGPKPNPTPATFCSFHTAIIGSSFVREGRIQILHSNLIRLN